MRNFHNVISDILETYYFENLDVHINNESDDDVYIVKIKQNNFSVTYEAILGRIPMVKVLHLQCEDGTFDENFSFANDFQSELIDQLYCGDIE